MDSKSHTIRRANRRMNPDVISIEEWMPHITEEVICVNCHNRWISVRPDFVWLKDLECPKCGEKGTVISTGQVI